MHNLVSMPVGTSLTRGIPSYTSLLRLPNGDVPLKLALAWLVICATPMSETGQQRGYYSSNFLADVLDVVSREAFDVSSVRCEAGEAGEASRARESS
jgi:hypothetical protein